MNFGLHVATSIGSGIGRLFGSRFEGAEKGIRSTRVTVDRFDAVDGVGGEWASARYGDYYATSAAIYAAVRTRADAVGRAEFRVEKVTESNGVRAWEQVEISHPMQRLVDRPNGSWS
jgi:hypothetical protein